RTTAHLRALRFAGASDAPAHARGFARGLDEALLHEPRSGHTARLRLVVGSDDARRERRRGDSKVGVDDRAYQRSRILDGAWGIGVSPQDMCSPASELRRVPD